MLCHQHLSTMAEMSLTQNFSDCHLLLGIILMNDVSALKAQFLQRGIQQFGPHFQNTGFNFAGSAKGCVAGNEGCPAGVGTHIPGTHIGVGVNHMNIINFQTQLFSSDLGYNGIRSLTHIRGTGK